jgi:hypothetical protein
VEASLAMPMIGELPALVAELPKAERLRFDRLFSLQVSTGRLRPPETMQGWIARSFGSVEAVREQSILRLTNRVTLEGALFNPLRGQRPLQGSLFGDVAQIVADTAGDQDESGFCKPESGTPADLFGRIRGRFCITASNIAKYEGWHGVIVFNQHNPLLLTREYVQDYLETGFAWLQAAHAYDPSSMYPFFMWNCLWKAGASVVHGHAQVSLAAEMAYPKLEALRRAAEQYKQREQRSYFEDLYAVHQALGLAVGNAETLGLRAFASLTPVKEKEVIIIARDLEALSEGLYQILDCYVSELRVQSFNVAVMHPPLAETSESWEGFPLMARIVDRGDPINRASDVGAMELYAASVISSDPFEVARALAGRLR